MNIKYPQLSFVYNRRKTASSTRKATVELRVSYDYRQKYISTGIMLFPNQWHKGCIVNTPDMLQISKVLDKLLTDVREVLMQMLESNTVDLDRILPELEKRKSSAMTFLDFCKKRAEVRKYGKSKDSQRRYDRFIRLFSEYGGIKLFSDVTEANIIKYDKLLQKKKLKANSIWYNYHRFLNSFIKDAVEEGYLTRNPYKWVAIQKDSDSLGLDRCLTPEEFQRLKDTKMITESLERVKDLFIFQTYTCLRYSDLAAFDAGRIKSINGRSVYTGSSKKTNKPFTIPLSKEALSILEKYHDRLPIISNVKYNLYLKSVAQAAGIDKPLSTHWARHTGATLLFNNGVDIKIVSRICGHSSIRITENIYAKLLDETVVDAVKNIE